MGRDRTQACTYDGASVTFVAVGLLLSIAACNREPVHIHGVGPGSVSSARITAASPPPPLDTNAITKVTGGTPETSGNVVKVNFPRKDVPVRIDEWNNVPPFMGLTSYAAFMPIEKGHAMMMGDLVVFEDEVNPVMSAALDHGLEVTALHNHFFFDKPHVYFMHVGGMGALEEIKATRSAAVRDTRAKGPLPTNSATPRSSTRSTRSITDEQRCVANASSLPKSSHNCAIERDRSHRACDPGSALMARRSYLASA